MERKLIFRLVGWHTNHQIIATHALRVHGTKALQVPIKPGLLSVVLQSVQPDSGS